jgi:hypothetical protein
MAIEKVKDMSIGAITATVILTLTQSGIFATKADVSALETKMASYYVLKSDFEKRLDRFETLLEQVRDSIYKPYKLKEK